MGRQQARGSHGLRDTVDLTELASRRRGVSFRALWGTHTSPKITSVTCDNVRMVTMDDCVHAVGLAGRCLSPEEPTKLVPAWVLLAVSFSVAHSWLLRCGPRSTEPARLSRERARGESTAHKPARTVVYCPHFHHRQE